MQSGGTNGLEKIKDERFGPEFQGADKLIEFSLFHLHDLLLFCFALIL